MEAEPGYVVVTPPNFAPGLFGLVTMDDTVRETYYSQNWLPRPDKTGFTSDIWPIFARMTALQWVNQGHYILSGAGSPLDAHDPRVFAKLRDQSADGKPWRQAVRSLFRSADAATRIDTGELAQVYSDYFGDIPGADLAPAGLALTPTMLAHLDAWVAGTVIDDWVGAPQVPDFAALTPEQQIAHLERAPLTECLGGPFHPGIELTWTMRLASVWERPYRLRVSPTGFAARQDFGELLTPAACLAAGGPYDGVAAGALTRFMGVPWQTDEASCNSGADYTPTYFLSLPTYWGARVPDQVLSLDHYQAMEMSGTASVQAIKHLSTRSDWLRDIRGRNYNQRIALMVKEWHDLGMVIPKGDSDPRFGGPARVEQGRSPDHRRGDPQPGLMAKILSLPDPDSVQGPPMAELVKADGGLQSLAGTPRRAYRRGEI
jgi:hypothetical protein